MLSIPVALVVLRVDIINTSDTENEIDSVEKVKDDTNSGCCGWGPW